MSSAGFNLPIYNSRFVAFSFMVVLCVHVHVDGRQRDTSQKFYLYTTPPRVELKDDDTSLFHAELVPAAKVYLGIRDTVASMTPGAQQDILTAQANAILSDAMLARIDSNPQSLIVEQRRRNTADGTAAEEQAIDREAELLRHKQEERRRQDAARGDNKATKSVPKWFVRK